jgi:hypothetical protein
MDGVPPNGQELNAARLSRYEIVEMMFKDGFEDVAMGELVNAKRSEVTFGGLRAAADGSVLNRRLCPVDGWRQGRDGQAKVPDTQDCRYVKAKLLNSPQLCFCTAMMAHRCEAVDMTADEPQRSTRHARTVATR